MSERRAIPVEVDSGGLMSSDPSAVAGVRAPTAIEQVRQRIEAAAEHAGWQDAYHAKIAGECRDMAAALLAVLDLADELRTPRAARHPGHYSRGWLDGRYESACRLRAAVVAAFQPKEGS